MFILYDYVKICNKINTERGEMLRAVSKSGYDLSRTTLNEVVLNFCWL